MNVMWDSYFLCPLEVHDETCVETDPSSVEPMEGFCKWSNGIWGFFFFFFN